MKFFIKKIFFLFLFWSTVFVGQKNELQKFSISDGLPSLAINDILQDEIGYLWLATDKGVVRFDGETFEHFTTDTELKVNTLFLKNENLFIGTKKGLSVKKGEQIVSFDEKEVLKIISIDNKIFVGTKQGIYELKNDYLQPIKINTKLDFSIINDLLFDGKSIFIASNKGLWKVDSLQKTPSAKKIIDGTITSLLSLDEKILAGTLSNGIKVLENSKLSSTIRTEKYISKISLINDEIWVSTNGNGIEILSAKDFSFQRKINKYNTLETNKIHTVFKDKQDNIWIATSKHGLYKYNLENSNLLENKNSIKNSSKPEIHIEGISVNYQKIDSIQVNNYAKVLQLIPEQNNLSITFKTVDINHPKNIQYRYKLFEKISPWSSNNSVDFGNLASGNYTFSVQSRNKDLEESNFKKFSFFIDTPIYKKPWFSWVIFSGCFLILCSIIFFSTKKIKKKNKEKIDTLKLENHLLSLEQKALQLQMNPHFIFNVLNGIKALGNNGNTKELNKTIGQFATLLRSVLNNSRQDEISLHQEIETIKNYIELEQKMNSISFSYTIKTDLNDVESDEILIPPMLIQPFVENAIKHGFSPKTKDGLITIYFQIKNYFLHCTITDNGIGFHQSKKEKTTTNHKSVALEVTKERIENLSTKSGFLIKEVIEENNIKGTKVQFKIPLKTDF